MASTSRRLEGKVAIITGGASGVGESTAKLFAEHGAKIVIADIQDQLGQAVCEAIGLSNSIYVHCDVSNEEDVSNIVDIAVATYGKLDIMFNNAATLDPYKKRVIDNEKTDFERVLSVNVTGAFLGMKHATRVMVPARAGSIISMASDASKIGGVASHAYTCSKHAVNAYAIATPMATSFMGVDVESIEKQANLNANLKGRGMSQEWCTSQDLFFLYCLLSGRPCHLAQCLAEYFSTYYHRQERGLIFGGVYVTRIARFHGLIDIEPAYMEVVYPVRLDSRTMHGMHIVQRFPHLGLRFALEKGVI
ncbi:hypothetical protein E3N88_14619 [Mikania micrantha]|uniref:Uncharacterized protein n=1 Tax=Mikania micrantha TaxID=192012 RepID=A0A5N6P210_9ASTR|nr:hypothetical protein E3N88_14619 [Mikania micrantha]